MTFACVSGWRRAKFEFSSLFCCLHSNVTFSGISFESMAQTVNFPTVYLEIVPEIRSPCPISQFVRVVSSVFPVSWTGRMMIQFSPEVRKQFSAFIFQCIIDGKSVFSKNIIRFHAFVTKEAEINTNFQTLAFLLSSTILTWDTQVIFSTSAGVTTPKALITYLTFPKCSDVLNALSISSLLFASPSMMLSNPISLYWNSFVTLSFDRQNIRTANPLSINSLVMWKPERPVPPKMSANGLGSCIYQLIL